MKSLWNSGSERRRVKVEFTEPGMTEQAHADEVKIQNIMKRYRQTGVIDHVNKYQGDYLNFADAPSYHEAMNIIAEAKSMFETVPAHIRADFDNDPQKYIDFMQDNANIDAIEEYGLDASHLTRPDPAETPVQPVDESVESPTADTE